MHDADRFAFEQRAEWADVDAPERGYVPPDNPTLPMMDAFPILWSYGLRNPWRISFDRLTGELWIADVGEVRFEEINVQPAGSTGGANTTNGSRRSAG